MIVTVAPFPSIEYIYQIDRLMPHCEIEASHVSLSILSKCIHSAEIIKILQGEPLLLSSLGGFAGKYIKHYLDKAKIKSDIIWSDLETPHKMKIVLESSSDTYLLQAGQGQFAQSEALHKRMIKLTQKLRTYLNQVSTLVIGGYLPDCIEDDFYGLWIKEAKKYNIKTLISTGQPKLLEKVIEESPYALLFTEKQLETLGIVYANEHELLTQLLPYFDKGIHYIGLYLKEKGAYMLSKHKLCAISFHNQVSLSKENTAASGAFLGAFAIGIQRKYEQEKFFKMCTAAALVACCDVDRPLCSKKDVDTFAKKLKIREINLSSF
ncbi:hypothetical protein CS063_09095 [Sporanaerobium hydrogeniformans]|uniref:Uncharacterized protein n=1 Tax=Sporanaerobium hydrogeniformans TaxID=3072179 RepID=A0AC61DD56_9FIRM|nr:hypothetical protein [Sporanaerobium hydrogeniformans]PHV70678.1 hypothetical protein CS063_09095 [Sporanaerobium hydrogeniformans]